MGQRIAHSRVSFAVSRELRPVMANRLVIVDEAALDLNMKRSRTHGFGNGEDREERVAIYLESAGLVSQTAPDIDHQFALEICGDLDTDLAARANSLVNCDLDRLIYLSHNFSRVQLPAYVPIGLLMRPPNAAPLPAAHRYAVDVQTGSRR